MKKTFLMTLALLCAVAQGAWAESVTFNVRSWDDKNSKVVTTSTTKDATVLEGSHPDDWLMLGSSTDKNDHYYVVRGNVKYQTLNVFGKAHIILADDATLTLTGGLKVEVGNNWGEVSIYSQSNGDHEGRLVVTNSYMGAAGIGSSEGRNSGGIRIHGGNLDITGGKCGAAIGAGKRDSDNATTVRYGIKIYGGTVVAQGGENGAGIGGGSGHCSANYDDTGEIFFYGGEVTATGGDLAAGIGGGGSYDPVFVNSEYGGGVGYHVYVYGGKVTAQGGHRGAGIGSGSFGKILDSAHGGTLTVSGGTVNATGGKYGAGIGGGCRGNGAIVNIWGGTVNAKGGVDGAGIGGGEYGNGGSVYISGGTVRAEGTSYGAGIGGGETTNGHEWGKGGDVTIVGGRITAIAGSDCKGRVPSEGSAIGCGQGRRNKADESNAGKLSLPVGYKVTAGDSESSLDAVFTADARIDACRWRNYVRIEPCPHTTPTEGHDFTEPLTYTLPNDTQHKWYCRYCSKTGTAQHNYPNEANCVCGKAFNADADTWTVTIHTTTDGTTFADGQDNRVVKGYKYTLPAPETVEGLIFMGYLETSTQPSTGIEMADAEFSNLINASDIITPTANKEYYARYRYDYTPTWTWADDGSSATCDISIDNDILKDSHTNLNITYLAEDESEYVAPTPNSDGQRVFDATAEYTRAGGITYQFTDRISIPVHYTRSISLSDNASNDELLEDNDELPANVTLTGRTLYKDGSWNTLCLPFDVTISGSVLDGAVVKTLSSSDYDSKTGILTLNFTESLSKIEAGKPYIVKWNGDGTQNIVSPIFEGVTISSTAATETDGSDWVDFVGTFSPITLEADDRNVLYLGADNTLYYPSADMTVGSCRAVFKLNGITAGDLPAPGQAAARRFVLNFGDGDETTGIISIDNGQLIIDNSMDAWYTLDGRRLTGKPTAKGLYINNGRKVVIK